MQWVTFILNFLVLGFGVKFADDFQAAKRKARGYKRFNTMRTVLFLIAGKLDFPKINGHAA